MLHDEPKLERREVMVRVSMQWAAVTRPEAESLVLSDQETFGEWRSQREAFFRDIDTQRIVAKWVRHD